MAEQHDVVAACELFTVGEVAPERRRDSEDAKEARRGTDTLHANRLGLAGEREIHDTPGGRVLEGCGGGLPCRIIRWDDRKVRHPALGTYFADLHQSICITVRQRAQQYRPRDAEDGRVHAEADRQRQDHDGSEARPRR